MKTAISTLLLLGSLAAWAAQDAARLFDKPRSNPAPLFPDPVVAKGNGFEIKRSQVDEMYLAFKGHRAAMGQLIPDSLRPQIESDIIDKLIATQLFLLKATDQDRAAAKEIADSFLAEQKKQVPSDDSFRRQLMAVGMTTHEFEAQIREQAIVKAVIDREIKVHQKVTDADARKFYAENPTLFREPELVRAAHILISTRDTITGKPLAPELKLEKRRLAQKIAERARAGEDFAKLAREFSEDTGSKDRGGEYTFPRAKDDPRHAMVPEFEAAAFSMKPNQISDVVETSYGYHVIKLLEKIPPKKIEYSQVEDRIKQTLLREAVEKALPDYIDKLRKESNVQVLVPDKKS